MDSYKKLIDFIKTFRKEDKDSFDAPTIDMAVAIQNLIEKSCRYYLKSYSEIVFDYRNGGEEDGKSN